VEEFQPKFEMFRLIDYRLVRASVLDLSEINPEVRDLARCEALSRVMLNSKRNSLRFSKEQDHHVYTESTNELHSVVIEALLLFAPG
jgi:hypothetical protein